MDEAAFNALSRRVTVLTFAVGIIGKAITDANEGMKVRISEELTDACAAMRMSGRKEDAAALEELVTYFTGSSRG